jgi:hypothetical protein
MTGAGLLTTRAVRLPDFWLPLSFLFPLLSSRPNVGDLPSSTPHDPDGCTKALARGGAKKRRR